jgi:hypothetical protein
MHSGPPLLRFRVIRPVQCQTLYVLLTQEELGAVSEFMESYQLIAFAFADEAAGSQEVVAGSVHGGIPHCSTMSC